MRKIVIAMLMLSVGCVNETTHNPSNTEKIDQIVNAMREVGAREVSSIPCDFESISVVKKTFEYNGKVYEVKGIVLSSKKYHDRYPYFVVNVNGNRISPVEEIELILANKIPCPEYNDRWGAAAKKLVANPPSEDFHNAYFDWANIPNAKVETLTISNKKVLHITNVESPMFVVEEKNGDSTIYYIYSYNK